MEGLDWVPGQIPPKIRSLEYEGGSSDTSIDTQAARAIEAVSVTTASELDQVMASTSATGDAQGGTHSSAGTEPAVNAPDGAGDPEADPGTELEAGPGSFAAVCQPGDATTIIRSHQSLSLLVFPDGPSHPLFNIGTTTRIGGAVGRETYPVLAH